MSTRYSTIEGESGMPPRFIQADGKDVLDMQEACDRLNEQEAQIIKLEDDIRQMVEKAAAKHLPAYREQGMKMMALEDRIAELSWRSISDRPDINQLIVLDDGHNVHACRWSPFLASKAHDSWMWMPISRAERSQEVEQS